MGHCRHNDDLLIEISEQLMETHYCMYSEVFASVSASGAAKLCSCSTRVHLLSQVDVAVC